jgi:quercetin dioxygenase-like cupin family protein
MNDSIRITPDARILLRTAVSGRKTYFGARNPMLKCWTHSTLRLQVMLCLVGCVFLSSSVALKHSVAEPARPAAPPVNASPEVLTVLSTERTVTGEPIHYPSRGPALITAVEIVLQAGEETGWHTHQVPLFGYILEGELTVDYGVMGVRTYRQGEGFAEATDQAHNGRNPGQKPVRILAVFIGMEGTQGTAPAPPPAR